MTIVCLWQLNYKIHRNVLPRPQAEREALQSILKWEDAVKPAEDKDKAKHGRRRKRAHMWSQ